MGDKKQENGSIGWVDLTVENAEQVRDFYAAVVGWKPEPVSMGDYSDFSMLGPESGEPQTGICHARGPNTDLPTQWLIYLTVDDIDASIASCEQLGGAVIAGPKNMAKARYCVIRDPAGAVAALYQPPGE